MTKRDIEENINHAFTSSVPNVLNDILSKCDDQKASVIIMSEVKSKKGIFKWTAGIAAVFALVFISVLGLHLYQTNYNVASVVSLDVNPSIEIKTNKNEKILEVNALNEDGKIVIGEMSFKGSSLDVTINALIGSMLRNGYLNDASNSILVSVYGENNESSSALQEKLTEEINSILKTYNTFSGAVLSQTILPDSDLQTLADSYGISLGKARLIRQVISQKPQYSLEELAGLTINELNLMSEINGISLEDVQVVGNASDKAYIGIDKAKEIAFSHAGVSSESDVAKLEIEMDYEHGILIYEVSFDYNNYEYDYDIDAITGAITKEKSNPTDDKGKFEDKDKLPSDNSTSDTDNDNNTNLSIGIDRAKEIAFSHAGVSSESSISKLEIETDYEHGVMIYEVSFCFNNYEYEYEIDASTGEITEEKSSLTDNIPPSGNSNNINSSSNANNNISADQAKEIAFSHAGVSSESSISKLEIETDYEHSALIYEISFRYNNYEYEYEIDAGTGEITEAKSHEKYSSNDNDQEPSKSDESSSKKSDPDSAGYIGEAAAKEIALSHAKREEDSITDYSCKTYIQQNTAVYKVKFDSNGYEYSYDVNAFTGEIVKYDMQPEHD